MIQINLNIGRDVMQDIFVTAIEGGSNYWFSISESDKEKIRTITHPSDPFSVRLFKFIFDHKRRLVVCNQKNKECIGVLYYQTIQERLQKLVDSEHSSFLFSEIEDNGDATSNDIVFQYLCLGDLIYG